MGYSKDYRVNWQATLLLIAGFMIIALASTSCAPSYDESVMTRSASIDVILPHCDVMPEPTPYPSPDFNCLESSP